MSRLLAAAAALIALLAFSRALPASAYVPHGATPFTVGAEYLALGDSLATGVGSSACPIGCAARSKGGYVAEFARRLRAAAGHDLTVRNFAVNGETTTSFIGDYFTNPQSRSQLARAVAEIRAHGARISPLTLDIGGNDALNARGPRHTRDEKQAALARLADNLETIVSTLRGALRAAGASAEPVLIAYYEPYGADDPDLWAFARLNQIIRDTGAAHGLRVAEPYAAFTGVERATTWMACKCVIDIHPNDRGHRLLADELARVTLGPQPRGATLSGAVRNAAGGPVPGATVWYGGAETTADRNGAFQLTDLPAGAALTFSAADPVSGAASSATLTLAPGEARTQAFVLADNGRHDGAADPAGSMSGARGYAGIVGAVIRAAVAATAHNAAHGAIRRAADARQAADALLLQAGQTLSRSLRGLAR